MQLLLASACACGLLRLGTAGELFDSAPWTDDGEWVSLETHPDGVTPFVPVPGDGGLCGALTTEVENFTVVSVPGHPAPFVVTGWGRDHYYGATFENTFAHSKALLHSTNQSVGSAHGSMAIPKTATYYVAVRYEAAYRFETEFTLKITGAGSFTKIYGQRESPKLWAFGWSATNHRIGGCGLDPTPECHWTWGATENWVTEYYPVSLSAGTANFEISVTNTTSKPGMAPLADRNIDAIVLTTNLSDIKMRALNEQGSVPMDGLFTQRNKVFMKVSNHGNDDMTLTVPFCAYHSSYAPMHMFCIPYCKASSNGKVYGSATYIYIPVPKGTTTPKWVEVGSRLDTMNDVTWEFTATKYNPPPPPPCPKPCPPKPKPPPCPKPCPPPIPPPKPPPFMPSYSVQFGVMVGGSVVPIATKETLSTTTATLEIALDASVSNFKRVRMPDDSLGAALAEAKNVTLPAGATAPKLTPIFGYTFCVSGTIRDIEPNCFLNTSIRPDYEKTFDEFFGYFPISDTSAAGIGMITDFQKTRKTGYFEARTLYQSPTRLARAMGNLTTEGTADDYMVVSMGDEIALPVPAGAAGATLFQKWMASTYPGVHVPAYNATICYDPKACNPTVHLYSNLYSAAYGLSVLSPATKTITTALKNAGVGANYSPLDYNPHGSYSQFQYWYPVNKAVTIYRKQAMTLPWSEDYTWQSPIGTQQMTTIMHDLFRAGLRGVDKTPQTSRIMSYIMAHAPGTTSKMWRRAMYGYLAHGVTLINLYEFRPELASYTENYVDDGWGMYGGVRQALSELTNFEDIVQTGRVAYGDVGIWNSEAMDIWGPVTQPIGLTGQHFNTWLAAKRAMYIALQHSELAVDMVVEDDIGPTLDSYKLIILTDTHVTLKASTGLAAWVAAGGTLLATAGAGGFDELNKTNAIMAKLLGVASSQGTFEPDEGIQFLKQDLINATVVGEVSFGGDDNSTMPAVAVRHMFTPAASSTVLANWSGTKASPAAVRTASGKGQALYFAFHPSFSYFLPALPVRPTDRGGLDTSYTHFVPSAFDARVLTLIKNVSAAAGAVPQVSSSNHLVHGKPIVSKTGKGVAIPLVNWAGTGIESLPNLTVTVNHPAVKPGMKATLATGGKVTELHTSGGSGGGVSFSLDLGIADALILR